MAARDTVSRVTKAAEYSDGFAQGKHRSCRDVSVLAGEMVDGTGVQFSFWTSAIGALTGGLKPTPPPDR